MDPSALPLGTQVGAWRVLSRGSHGSYGMVYRVERAGNAEAGTFALKLALRQMDPRFEREAELLSRLTHAHVPRLFDQGVWVSPEGVSFPFLVMEWVEGVPLYEWAVRHRVSSRQVLGLLAQVASALAATHAAGGVHRDVKGDNVLVSANGAKAFLVDFGSGSYAGARRLTWRPEPPGTFQYWSIEALRFRWRFRHDATAHYEAGPADDVYALGVMAYRLVTGVYPPPLESKALDAGDGYVRSKRVAPEKQAHMSPKLAALIRQMLAEKPSMRGNAAEVAHALERAAKDAGRQASRVVTRRPKQVAASTLGARLRGWRVGMMWLGWLTAAALAVLWAGSEWTEREVWEEKPMAVLPQEYLGEAEDGGTSGLASTAFKLHEDTKGSESTRGAIGLEMPKTPLPGQRRPPCKRYEVEVSGGCWHALQDKIPPCDEDTYSWKNRCYLPSPSPRRPATSEPP
ncbi:serine/threonine-protein kinase [Stigmatella sp. ncwal1]|uniref:non-specific serine/threonine protein kinase n=1 Tax=Stigmatella ashevillensis TaxID=2995309 RepID=A0ABT5DGP8_9BACT|nr:serine/threonine-protein kinase [Stigmatella ashevillena]MDC0712842.1 serine/threonine-protein kinase [Stigmatella ashevillena]